MNSFNVPIDIEDPFCFFCKKSLTAMYGQGEGLLYTDEFFCSSCQEEYSYIYLDDKLIKFTITCFGLRIILDLENNQCGIKSATQNRKVIWVPPFKIDFSNKENLLKKLNNYLIFS